MGDSLVRFPLLLLLLPPPPPLLLLPPSSAGGLHCSATVGMTAAATIGTGVDGMQHSITTNSHEVDEGLLFILVPVCSARRAWRAASVDASLFFFRFLRFLCCPSGSTLVVTAVVAVGAVVGAAAAAAAATISTVGGGAEAVRAFASASTTLLADELS
jgi:hypothetical protein